VLFQLDTPADGVSHFHYHYHSLPSQAAAVIPWFPFGIPSQPSKTRHRARRAVLQDTGNLRNDMPNTNAMQKLGSRLLFLHEVHTPS
jgi:hypothetical protein